MISWFLLPFLKYLYTSLRVEGVPTPKLCSLSFCLITTSVVEWNSVVSLLSNAYEFVSMGEKACLWYDLLIYDVIQCWENKWRLSVRSNGCLVLWTVTHSNCLMETWNESSFTRLKILICSDYERYWGIRTAWSASRCWFVSGGLVVELIEYARD